MKRSTRIFSSLLVLILLASLSVSAQKPSGAKGTAQGSTKTLYRIRSDEGWGFIDNTGKLQFSAKVAVVWDFSEGLVPFSLQFGGSIGYMNEAGEVVIPAQFGTYHELSNFSDGLALVKCGGTPCYIDRKGQSVITLHAGDEGRWFREGLALVMFKDAPSDHQSGYIDKSGKTVIPPRYKYAGEFSEGLAWVWEEGSKKGFIDKQGTYAIPPQFEDAMGFSEGLAPVAVSEAGQRKWGYIDKKGKMVIRPQFDSAYPFSEGLAGVELGEKRGFINRAGKLVIPAEYASVDSFAEGLAWVCRLRHFECGYINATGKAVIPLGDFDEGEKFKGGIAAVGKRGVGRGYIDKQGKFVWGLSKAMESY